MPPAAELVADKGYDSKALRDWLAERGTTAVIPPRKNRKVQYHYDKTVYRQRNIIERMFCRLKDWRRIATRFDRNIKNFIAAIALAAAVIWWAVMRLDPSDATNTQAPRGDRPATIVAEKPVPLEEFMLCWAVGRAQREPARRNRLA